MENSVTEPSWVCLPAHSKTNLLTLSCGEGKCNVYCKNPGEGSARTTGISLTVSREEF